MNFSNECNSSDICQVGLDAVRIKEKISGCRPVENIEKYAEKSNNQTLSLSTVGCHNIAGEVNEEAPAPVLLPRRSCRSSPSFASHGIC